jgi:ABC-type multidrug transport system fused ATPase/permease subunit
VANEALSAIRTVQAFTAVPHEENRFAVKVDHVRSLAIKEARASATFFGASGWAGEVIELGLLVYGMCRPFVPLVVLIALEAVVLCLAARFRLVI